MTIKLLLLSAILFGNFHTQKREPTQGPQQFIYVLRYNATFKQAIKWSAKEGALAREHVIYLKDLMDNGNAYLIGRTPNMYDPNLFGVVIFDAPDLESAKKIMDQDPLIKNNIMEGELSPFQIVLMKK